MSLTIKVFYTKPNGGLEIRRFTVNPTLDNHLYETVTAKIKQLYPTVTSGEFQLSWKDSDGDSIVFSCNEELQEATSCVHDGVLRIYLTATNVGTQATSTPQATPTTSQAPPQPESTQPKTQNKDQQQQQQQQQQQHQSGPYHAGVTCDGCEGPIYGIRYKCCVCHDFDLCSSCEGKGMHSEHNMFKIERPRPNPMSFLPPHLGRYINRYMQGWNGAHASSSAGPCGASASASAGASAGCGAGPAPDAKAKEQYDDYLKSVGADIAAFLDPFGIDVTYDVHHGGDKHHRGGFHHGCGAWQNMRRRTEGEKKKEDMETNEGEKKETESQEGKTSGSHDVPMEDLTASEPLREKSPTEEWTFVPDDGTEVLIPSDTAIPMPAPTPTAPSGTPAPTSATPVTATPVTATPVTATPVTATPVSATPVTPPQTTTTTAAPPQAGNGGRLIYPNLRIQQSLDQMLSMGFTNTGGWLSDLLNEHDGDIGAVLDAVKVKATQQLESLSGAH